jgi:hypothetical protein
MVSNKNLIEREAKKRSKDTKLDTLNQSSKIIVEFDLDTIGSNIEYKNLDDQWNTLCSIEDLTTRSLNEIQQDTDLIISEEVLCELKSLQSKLQLSWDDKLSMYMVSYRENEDGSSELYIPLETEYTNDYIVERIYNKDNKFVSKEVEKQINFPMYEIETKDLYVESIKDTKYDSTDVYTTNKETFDHFIQRSSQPVDNSSQYKATIATLFAGSLVMNILPLIFYILVSTKSAMILYAIMNIFMLMPIILPLAFLVIITTYFECYSNYKRQGLISKKHLFETTNLQNQNLDLEYE